MSQKKLVKFFWMENQNHYSVIVNNASRSLATGHLGFVNWN